MQAIVTKYLGPTNTRGGRIVAQCDAGRRVFPYNHALNVDQNHRAAALALASDLGWLGDYYGQLAEPGWLGDHVKGWSYAHVFVPSWQPVRGQR